MNRRVLLVGAAAVVAAAAVIVVATGAGAGSDSASAVLRTAEGTEIGKVSFAAKSDRTEVTVHLDNVPEAAGLDAFHGFHVHANDNAENGEGCVADAAKPSNTWFVSADGHLKAAEQTHGEHNGDLPSVYVGPDGSVEARFSIDRLAPGDVTGKAVILHAKADNFGNVPVGAATNQYTPNNADATTLTANTGNAGDRIACGVVD
jgi:superoxide dismutase, Cu-Zn family